MKEKIQIKDNIVRVPLSDIHVNTWNPNKQSAFIYEKELTSIRTHGFLDPIDVREREAGGYEIVDGEHRYKAAKELGMTELPVNNLGKISAASAKQLTVIRNETRGQSERTALSSLLHDLIDNEHVSVDELKTNLPIDPVDIDSFLKDLKVDWDDVGDPEAAKDAQDAQDAPGTERMTYVLPVELADRFRVQLDRFRELANGGEAVAADKVAHPEAFQELVAYLEKSSVREPIR